MLLSACLYIWRLIRHPSCFREATQQGAAAEVLQSSLSPLCWTTHAAGPELWQLLGTQKCALSYPLFPRTLIMINPEGRSYCLKDNSCGGSRQRRISPPSRCWRSLWVYEGVAVPALDARMMPTAETEALPSGSPSYRSFAPTDGCLV